MWIDSHCHLTFQDKMDSIGGHADVVARAVDAGVTHMITINCRQSDEFPSVLEMAKRYENVWCSMGTHPHEAGDDAEQAVTLEDMVARVRAEEKIVGIGETGLDYYYNNSPAADQQESFRKHIRACIETDLPLIIHSRDADEDMMRILKEEGAGTPLKGLFHCFSSSAALAEFGVDFGFYISFSGILTFKKSEELRDIAKNVPLDKLLVETDSPFLAPEPHRGKVCEPAYTALTGTRLAELHNTTPEEMASQTTKNFYRLFTRTKPV